MSVSGWELKEQSAEKARQRQQRWDAEMKQDLRNEALRLACFGVEAPRVGAVDHSPAILKRAEAYLTFLNGSK